MAVQPPGRLPAETPLYRTVRNHLETYLALCRDGWEEEHVSRKGSGRRTQASGAWGPR